MEALAPPVVAVVVAHDPGPWFEEALAAVAAQDYAELSILVLDVASGEDLTQRVARVVPTAYVRRFDENQGFGATVNAVPSMVDGAAYYLLCHDDVAPFPDLVHLLVEEAFRSNAGIVSPKVVSWDDPTRLIHVGMAVDKTGSAVERVHPYEIDHGQHDAVRDVFLAPGGCTLVRADLFVELGGYDPAIVAMGEDLDLCWRAQVAGARIVVAPDARVRHREELAAGARPLEQSLWAHPDDGQPVGPAPTLQELQRRHELLAALKCYGRFHLLRVLPQAAALATGEVIVAQLAGNRARAGAVVRAWRWNLGRLPALRAGRAKVRALRRLPDREVRQLQLRGSARLSSYGRRLFQHGFHGAHADELASAAMAGGPDAASGTTDTAEARVTDDVAITKAPGAEGTWTAAYTERGRMSGSARLATWLAAGLVLVIGSRSLITGRLPAIGQFAPFPSWGATFGQFFNGWHPAGVGTTAPATPALALVGLLGTVLLGAMGLAQKVLVLGCVPLGAWGVVRLLRPFGSQRASLVAGLSYLAMALPYDDLATGRLGALVLYAGSPWVLGALFRATGLAPYAPVPTPDSSSGDESADAPGADADAGAAPPRRRGSPAFVAAAVSWIDRRRDVLVLGLLEAVLVSFAPAAVIVVLLSAIAVAAATLVAGAWPASLRVLRLAVASTGVAALICLPWLIGVLSAGTGAVSVFGTPLPASSALGWGSVLRFADGPIGASALGWGFAVAALAPLVLGRGRRFGWAARLWSVALFFWLAAWAVGRGWTGSWAPDVAILLAPAAAAVASSIGLGIAAFEEDVPAAAFGWRQLVTALAAVATLLGAAPTLVSALPGTWNQPSSDFSQAVAWMRAKSDTGAFRVLWLGDPRALDLGSWPIGGGLAYATSENGPPDARWLWAPAGPGPAAQLATAVDVARRQGTDQVGQLLAPASVRYVVVLTALAPQIPGDQTTESLPIPGDVLPTLDRQLDLSTVLSGTGMTVYQNTDWVPTRVEVAPVGRSNVAPIGRSKAAPVASPAHIISPVLPGPAASTSYRGPLVPGIVAAAMAPAGRWVLQVGGRTAQSSATVGWGGRYVVPTTGIGVLGFDGGPWPGLALAYSIVVWLAILGAVLGRRRVEEQWSRLRRPRSRRPRPAPGRGNDWDEFEESMWADTPTESGVPG